MEIWTQDNLKFDGQNGLVPTYRNVEGEILETGARNCLWLLCISWDGGVLEYIMLLPSSVELVLFQIYNDKHGAQVGRNLKNAIGSSYF